MKDTRLEKTKDTEQFFGVANGKTIVAKGIENGKAFVVLQDTNGKREAVSPTELDVEGRNEKTAKVYDSQGNSKIITNVDDTGAIIDIDFELEHDKFIHPEKYEPTNPDKKV